MMERSDQKRTTVQPDCPKFLLLEAWLFITVRSSFGCYIQTLFALLFVFELSLFLQIMLWLFLLFLTTFILLSTRAHDNFSFLVGSVLEIAKPAFTGFAIFPILIQSGSFCQ